MANALPILLAGGAALLLMGGKKKSKSVPDSGKELPDVTEDEPEDAGAEPAEPDPAGPEAGPEAEPEPEPEPAPGPGIPAPEKPKRPLGPTGAGSCANDIYRRDAVYIDPQIADRLNQGAMTAYNDAGYYFYIRHEAQDKIFDAAITTFAAMASNQSPPTLRSVVLREILNDFVNNHCDWDVSTDKFDEPMKLVWDDGVRLLTLAQMMVNYSDPHPDFLFRSGKRYTMPRGPLGIPEKGIIDPKINQRVMILATDKSLQNAEHLIARVHKLSGPNGESDRFEVRIVDSFKGKDVRPKLTDKHGFKELSNAFFNKMAPTGLYRVYAEGVV